MGAAIWVQSVEPRLNGGSLVGPLCFAVVRALTDDYRIMSILAVGVSLVLMAGAFYADNPQRKLTGAL